MADNENRNHMISTRVTDTVYQKATDQLAPWGITIAEFVRLQLGALANGTIKLPLTNSNRKKADDE